MISLQHSLTGPRSTSGQPGATIYTPDIPIWFHRFRTAKEPDPDLKVDPSDINFTSELRCPNCDQFSADSICICGATIQLPNTGELP